MLNNKPQLILVYPDFSSTLTDLILELDYLRKKVFQGSTWPCVFFQLKNIFHTLESIGSARIEGNNTTIAEYIEYKMAKDETQETNIVEIVNMEKALQFIEENVLKTKIDRDFISELHRLAVANLPPPPNGEGDSTPGIYRTSNVRIKNSSHRPPPPDDVQWYMDELFDFIDKDDEPKYHLLKIAISHHRFVWIHPFTNGNGRTVRLFTYAAMVKAGFQVNVRRIINPSAVFCSDRIGYYNHLAKADSGKKEDLLAWCHYVLSGLKSEIDKIDKLLDYPTLQKEILFPTIAIAIERKLITPEESLVLKLAIEKQIIMARDVKSIFPGKHSSDISHIIGKLKEKKMLCPLEGEKSRKYFICFENNFLLRGFIKTLGARGFLPLNETNESAVLKR
jgi:Fic family protein